VGCALLAAAITSCSTSATPIKGPFISLAQNHCRSNQLQLTLDRVIPPLSNQPAAFFRYTNVSSSTCTLYGYPTLQTYTSSGKLIGTSAIHNGSYQIFNPGPHLVTLVPGGSAYFGYGFTDVTPSGTTAECVDTSTAKSVPPGDTTPLTTSAELPSVCPGLRSVTAVATTQAFVADGSPAKP
jgi:hypothetical protein